MSWSYTHKWKLAATPAEVFAALVEPGSLLAWFAESVDVEPKVGGAYRFWGKHTLGAPSAADATQRITLFEPGAQLGFSWRVHGVETTVDIALEATEKGTTLVLTHEAQGDLPVPRQSDYLGDHWRFQFGNLAAHLSGGEGIVRPDFTDAKPEVRITTVIDATAAEVWRTLTDPGRVAVWFTAPAVRISLAPGGEYRLGWRYKVDGRDVDGGSTHILEIVPGERLVLDWPDWRGDNEVTGQFISFAVEPDGERTRLHFVHGGFMRTADLSDYPFGWAWFMSEFKKVAERAGA